MPEQLGARLARLRAAQGWTQQELAERIAVSRVAVSHFELDLQVPSERTIALLASVFNCEPADLVAGTYYPTAKAERLPLVVARYTELDKQLCLLERDLQWLARVAHLPQAHSLALTALHEWLHWLAQQHDSSADRRSRQQMQAAQRRVQDALAALAGEPGTKN